MKKILLFLTFMIPNIAYCCPSLAGTWTSSLDKFESFNKKWANVDPKPWSYMIQTQGLEVIKFTANNEMLISSPEVDLKIGERKIKRPSSTERVKFDILGCSKNSIVLTYERNGNVGISELHFENDDSYWVYMGRAGADGNSHIREYYTRNK